MWTRKQAKCHRKFHRELGDSMRTVLLLYADDQLCIDFHLDGRPSIGADCLVHIEVSVDLDFTVSASSKEAEPCAIHV